MITGEVDAMNPGMYEVVYDYEDSSGNPALRVTRMVEVVDTTAPVITLNGAAEVFVEAGSSYSESGAYWTDIVDGEGSAMITGEVDVMNPGMYEVVYDYEDSSGNPALRVTRMVEVVDTTAPVITLNGAAEVFVEAGSSYSESGAYWTDIVDGEGSAMITGEVDAMNPGMYEVVYDYEDSSGNPALRVTRMVEVVDTTAPVITLNGAAEVFVEAGSSYSESGAYWTDIVDGEGSAMITGEVDVMNPGMYEVVYDYEDSSGNPALRVTRMVEVVDTTAPVITLNGAAEVFVEAGSSYSESGAYWTDIVDGEGSAMITGEVDVMNPGMYEVVYDYEDSSGNPALTRMVEVVDTTAPVITLNGAAEVFVEAGSSYSESGAYWTDIVDGEGSAMITGEVDVMNPGMYEIYDYEDSSGNPALRVTRMVEVMDTTAPVITLNGAAEVFVEAGSSYSESGAYWTDIVDGEGSAMITGEVDVMNPGMYEVVYDYEDSSGNSALRVTRMVEVVDTTAPVIDLLGEEKINIFVWEEFIDPWVEAYDILDGNLTSQVIREGEVLVGHPGLYELVYRVADSYGNEATHVFRTVEVINRSPNALVLSNQRISENLAAGTVIGEFKTMDPDDANGSKNYQYELVGNNSLVEENFVLHSDGVLKLGSSLDYEERSEYQLQVRVWDEFGGVYDKNFTIGVEDQFIPIVDTASITKVNEDGYLIGGILLDDGGSLEALEFGVLVSDRPIIKRDQDGVKDLSLQLNEESMEFGRYYGPNPDWKKLYVRAYALNGEGISYGLEEQIRLNPVAKTVDQWSGATALAEVPGWWESEWFGIYFKSRESGWILHSKLGWAYPSPSPTDGLWMWKEGLGWIWTDDGIYPYFYSQYSGDWLYFFGDFNQQRLLFDYGVRKWKRLNEVGVDESEGSR